MGGVARRAGVGLGTYEKLRAGGCRGEQLFGIIAGCPGGKGELRRPLTAPFTVDVTNSTLGQVIRQPVVAYTPPVVRAALVSQFAPGPPPALRRGFDTIEVPRGSTVFLYVRPMVDREGQLTLDGQPAGNGQTSILSWALRSGSADGPAGQISGPGAVGGPSDAIVQQWNTPDAIGRAGPLPYYLAIDYTVRTTYPDGQVRDYNFFGPVPVTVAYSANSG